MGPTQHSTHELSPADILRRVKDIYKTAQNVFAWGLEPYSQDRPAPTVNHLADISMLYPTYYSHRYIPCFCSGLLTFFLLCRNSVSMT
jgi:hypothetical protein